MAEKVGQVLWSAAFDTETGKFEWFEYVLRTIRGGKAYATQKNICTWGKKSSKNGDYGWLDPIAPMWRQDWRLGNMPAWMDLHTTKLAALRYAKKTMEAGDFENDEAYEKAKKTVESMITKYRPKKKPLIGG